MLFQVTAVLYSQLALSYSQKLGLDTWVDMALVPCLLDLQSADLASGHKVKNKRGNTQGTKVLRLA